VVTLDAKINRGQTDIGEADQGAKEAMGIDIMMTNTPAKNVKGGIDKKKSKVIRHCVFSVMTDSG
jgi:hypothetical protein